MCNVKFNRDKIIYDGTQANLWWNKPKFVVTVENMFRIVTENLVNMYTTMEFNGGENIDRPRIKKNFYGRYSGFKWKDGGRYSQKCASRYTTKGVLK